MAVAAELEGKQFEIGEFLAREREKDLLRFSTAGSVDDGKSTLIGRLLYDTQSVYEDQVRSIQGKGTTAPGQIDFALLTDGLRAEREQGITIDVAYRYFSTPRRKFIIADTPGHEQYTRNMATGASTADAAIVLIDASRGVQIQSRRHAYIASLLGVRHVVVAVNKMDLIGYGEAEFRAIEAEFSQVLDQIAEDTGTPVERTFVPVSALKGDNVVHRERQTMPWYEGPSLLEILEQLPAARGGRAEPFRFPVQRVLRPDHTFRGFAGQIAAGTVRPGDAITVLPSGKSANVARIVTWDGDLAEAVAPLSVTLVLDKEIDISRGDLIVSAEAPARASRGIEAALVWMNERPLEASRRYLLKHASHTVPALVSAVDHRVDLAALAHQPAAALGMNDIGVVRLSLLRPIAADRYAGNRVTGAFILIDPESNATVAAGMIRSTPEITGAEITGEAAHAPASGPVTAREREARWGHRGAVLSLRGPAELIDAIERSLFAAGVVTCRLDAGDDARLLGSGRLDWATAAQTRSGLLSLVVRASDDANLTARVENHMLEDRTAEDNTIEVDADDSARAIAAVHELLRRSGVFTSPEKAGL